MLVSPKGSAYMRDNNGTSAYVRHVVDEFSFCGDRTLTNDLADIANYAQFCPITDITTNVPNNGYGGNNRTPDCKEGGHNVTESVVPLNPSSLLQAKLPDPP